MVPEDSKPRKTDKLWPEPHQAGITGADAVARRFKTA
jgi:hypothetical protein